MPLNQAASFLQQGRAGEAERICRQILARAPGDFGGRFLLAIACFTQGRAAEALGHYDQAVALQPRNAQLFYNRANALFALERLPAALADYERAIRLAPGFAPAWNNRGNVLRVLGRMAEAIDSYGRVLRLDRYALPVRMNRADLLHLSERHAEALAEYRIVLAQAPQNAQAWLQCGDLERELGRIDHAIEAYTQAVKLHPGLAKGWSWLGLLTWLEHQDLAAATAHLERALALDPEASYVPGLLLHLKMMACDWSGLERGIKALDAAVCAGKPVSEPFAYLTLCDSPRGLLRCARDFTRRVFPPQPLPQARASHA
jgi:tetratricopeptide (TPR) repeat protein